MAKKNTRPRQLSPEDPVQHDELKKAVLEAIAQRFGHRYLDLKTARSALQDAMFELGMAHLRAIAERSEHGKRTKA
jgi:hypothetical protein